MAKKMSWRLIAALFFAGVMSAGAQSVPCASVCAMHSQPRVAGDWQAEKPVRIAAASPRNAMDLGSDLGQAPAEEQLGRMILLLEPSGEQKAALDSELEAQQTPGSCGYHKWLSAREFADKFAVSEADAGQVAAWLRSQGLTVAPLPAGRGWIEFSGTAAQVEQAFHAEVHEYAGPQGSRYVLSGDISVPQALAPVIHGLVSLDGALAAAVATKPEPVETDEAALAAMDSAQGAEAVTPRMMAQSLHLDALHNAGNLGAGETIAIPARSRIDVADVSAFQAAFGLAPNQPKEVSGDADGSSAGFNTDQPSAELAAEWAGAAAPKAQIVVVSAASTGATDGVDLALGAVIDRELAHTVVVNYSDCEAGISESHRAFYAALYRQAAAEGITLIAAAGDSGAAACHASGAANAVTAGLGVNAIAATPWNTSVGAAASAGGKLAAWSTAESAQDAYASGGGASSQYARPEWQTVTASALQGRLIPEIALPAGANLPESSGLAFCFADANGENTSGNGACTLMRSGGSGAAAAIFGGISALLEEKYGAQGNLAPRLYELSGQSGIFEDVTEGDARLACAAGSAGCDAAGRMGYTAGAGYDLATGLGSVNAQALVKAWPQATGTGATEIVLTYSPTQANDTYNPSAVITFTATVASKTSGATPTGTVSFTDSTSGAALAGSPVQLSSAGTATLAVSSGLSIGGNNIVASYSGYSTYAANSAQPVVITLEPSSTTVTVTPSTTTPASGANFTVTAALTVGSPVAGAATPAGEVTLNLDGKATGAATLTTSGGQTSASFTVAAPSSAGAHTLQAVYAGNTDYDASTSNPVTLTVAKGAVTITLTAAPATMSPGIPEAFTAVLAAASGSTGGTSITGTVSFYDGNTLLGTATVTSYAATLSSVALDTTKSHLITAVYSGDTNWAAVTSAPLSLLSAQLPDTVTLTAMPTAAGPGQAITFTATVTPVSAPAANYEQNPTGKVTFYIGTTVIGSATLAAAVGNSSTATFTSANLPAGSDVVAAVYAGDSYFAIGTSNTVTVTVQDFSVAPAPSNPSNLTIMKGQSGTASFIVSGLGGFGNQIQVTCNVPPPADMTCSATPVQVTPTSTVTFTIQTYTTGGPSSTTTTSRRGAGPGPWMKAAGGFALAFVVVLAPIGRRARTLRRWMALVLLLAGLCGAGMGCGSSSNSNTSGDGTPLGVATITITATAYVDQATVSHSVYLNVNVVPGS